MSFFSSFGEDLAPYYVDLDNSLGAYVADPGHSPMIILDTSLKDKQESAPQLVYQALLDFHRKLPEVYRLFPLIQYFEDLQPEPVAVEPEIIIFARPARRWGYAAYFPDEFRLIG